MTNYVVTTPINGTFEVPDDQINASQISLNLIGRGVTNYGQAVAQNEINLLQNFAGPTAPNKPIVGQLWYNSTTKYLQIYTAAGTWSSLAYEAELANYATAAQLADLTSTVNTLATNAATKSQLNNYVTIAGLYTPSAGATAVPVASGGIGITTLGTPGQVLTVNSFGTGFTYSSPSSVVQYPIKNVTANTTLVSTDAGSLIYVGQAGITITMPQAVRVPAGQVISVVMPLAGTVTIAVVNGDGIQTGTAITGATLGSSFVVGAGEQFTFASNGSNAWIAMSQSRMFIATPTAGDNTTKIANTAFVTTAVSNGVAPYLLSSTAAATYAPINSPTFTGTPQTPTPAISDSSAIVPNTYWVSQKGLQLVPPGAVMAFATSWAPTGWLKANGANVSRTTYAALFAYIGTFYGAGDGSTTFTLPDLRGVFVRGWDDSRGMDSGRNFGSLQTSALGSHSHTASSDAQGSHSHSAWTDAQGAHSHGGGTGGVGDHTHSFPPGGWGQAGTDNGGISGVSTPNQYGAYSGALNTSSAAGAHNHVIYTDGSHGHNVGIGAVGNHYHNITVNATGIAETRPTNFALLYCIKY